jgi:Ser/Thr protein kinase RdoA (MazF antagonist)
VRTSRQAGRDDLSRASPVERELGRAGHVPYVIREVFGTEDGEQIEAAIDAFCTSSFGDVAAHEFFVAGVGCVHGIRLVDGRCVLVKVTRPGTSIEFLAATQAIQRHLAAAGFPCPMPLAGPTRVGAGLAVAETYLDVGNRGDPHEPALRESMAVTLARLIDLCRTVDPTSALASPPLSEGTLWGRPHDGRFDFDLTAEGAEWIDELANRARERLSGRSTLVIGHHDWRAENMRFTANDVVAVYDWDSLDLLRETELVGAAASYFTSDFQVETRVQRPTLSEIFAFITDYETARGTPFTDQEQRELRAVIVDSIAYGARCEHSDVLTDFGRTAPTKPPNGQPPDGSARAFLARHAEELLS